MGLTLVSFGDSIANGVGAHGRSYPILVAKHLDARHVDMTGTSMMAVDALKLCDSANGADIALVAFGVNEALVRISSGALKYLPRRWRRPGWTDPRPYYSTRFWKRALQRVDSELRWRVKILTIRLFGGESWSCPADYETALTALIESLAAAGVGRIVVIGGFRRDERFFPGSASSHAEFLSVEQRVADAMGAIHCDASTLCQQWDDFLLDHFHPNEVGHRRIAAHVIGLLT